MLIQNAWSAIFLYHVGMVTTMLAFKKPKISAVEKKRTPPWYYLTAFVFASGGAIFYLVMPYFAAPTQIAGKLAAMGLNSTNWPYFAVYFCLVNSVIEEFFWRGYLAPETTRLHSDDLFFGGYHALVVIWFTQAYWAIPVLAACAFGGWLWRKMRRLTGNLTLPILTHIAADASIIAAVHFRLFAR